MSVLERADDEELQCYLLQLVQALRFERSDKSRLSYFLVERCKFDARECSMIFMFDHTLSKSSTHFTALCNTDLASFLRWYVAVELHDHSYARRFYSTYELLEESMLKVWYFLSSYFLSPFYLSLFLCYIISVCYLFVHFIHICISIS